MLLSAELLQGQVGAAEAISPVETAGLVEGGEVLSEPSLPQPSAFAGCPVDLFDGVPQEAIGAAEASVPIDVGPGQVRGPAAPEESHGVTAEVFSCDQEPHAVARALELSPQVEGSPTAEALTETLRSANGPPNGQEAWIHVTPETAPTFDHAVLVRSQDRLTGTGGLRVAVVNAGLFSPGNSPGIINLPSFSQGPGGTTLVELGGTTPGTGAGYHDQWNVSGLAELDGTLEVQLYGGFIPSLGDTFTILTWGARIGGFAHYSGMAGIPGHPELSFVPVYGEHALTLEVVETHGPTQDADGDGFSYSEESLAGTNPDDATSLLSIDAIDRSGGDVAVSFRSVLGQTYRVEWSGVYPGATWNLVTSNLAGTGATLQVVDPGAASAAQRFYRVQTATGVSSMPSGWMTLTAAGHGGGSSSRLSVLGLPLTRPVAYRGNLESFGAQSIVDTGATWTDDRFNGPSGAHYLEITSGALAGFVVDITDTDAATRTLTLAEPLPHGLIEGDTYNIRSHWTLASVFGAANESGLGGGSDIDEADNVISVDPNGTTRTYFYCDYPGLEGWRDINYNPAGGVVIGPDQGFFVRRRLPTDVLVALTGAVKSGPGQLDIAPTYTLVGTVGTAGRTLDDLGLYTGDPGTGVMAGSDLDEADNVIMMLPSGATISYFYCDFPTLEGWRDVLYQPAGQTPIPVGSAFFVKLQPAHSPFRWTRPVRLATAVAFQDPDLEQAVRKALQVPDGVPVLPADMLGLTALDLNSNVVDSLVGLEYATNLRSLSMVPADHTDPGHLSSLAPLAGLTSLRQLVLQRAGLNDTELATLGSHGALESLDLRYNQITHVSVVSGLPALSSLLLEGNPLADLGALAGKLIHIDVHAAGLEKATTVAEVADALHDLPLAILEFVLNTFEFEPYAGAMKGAQAVLETGAGNDWDIALLLSALLAHAGINTRFVHGQIEVPLDQTMDWLGVTDPDAAALVLVNAGIPQLLGPTFMRFDHTWLEAQLPVPGAGLQWLAVDPSWKFKDFQEGVTGLLAAVPFDETNYLAQPRLELAYEFYARQVAAYLTANRPGTSVADVAYDGPIIPQHVERIDGTLPYAVVGSTTTYSAVPAAWTHRVGLRLTSAGLTHFDQVLVLPDVSLQRVTVSYASVGGQLRPQLRLDGQVYAESPYLIAPGASVTFAITHYDGDGDSSPDRTDSYVRQAGQYVAVGLDAGQISGALLNRLRQDVNDAALAAINGQPFAQDDRIGAYLALGVSGYFYQTRLAEQVVGDLTRSATLYRRVASGLTTSESSVQVFQDLQFPYRPDALSIDLANTVYHAISIDGDQTLEPQRRRIVLHNKSAQEHAIWESSSQTASMSTIKSLQLAHEAGVPVYVIDASWSETLIRSTLQLSTTTESDIVWRVLSQGETVTVPRQNTPLQDWDGVGYLAEKDSGSSWYAAYMISGGLAGAIETIQGGYISGDPDFWDAPYLDPYQYDVGDPINIANGNVSHEETDVQIPNIGFALGFSRYYNSTVTVDVGFGPGWTHTWSDFLTFNPDSSVTWTDSSGIDFRFVSDGLGGYQAPVSLHGATFTQSGGNYVYRDSHGSTRTFDGGGRFTEIRDRNDNALSLSYNGSGQLISVADTHAPARALTFVWGVDGLGSVSDFTGRTWTYTHDASGRLASATTPTGGTTLPYTAQYEYYTDTARLGLLKQVTHPDGGAVLYTYYANRRGFQVTDPEGYTHWVDYNVYRHQSIFTDERGFESTHTYNDQGNLVETRHPDGSVESWTWQDSLKKSWTDPFGRTETYTYDSLGNLTRVIDRAGVVTDYAYETTYSNLTRTEQFGGRVTTFDYDARGNLVTITDALGHRTTLTYDARGLLLSSTQPKGNLTPDPADYRTTYTYNAAGQVVTQTTDLPSTVTYGYDSRGNRVSVTDANAHTTTYDYDRINRLVGMTNALGQETAFTYDAAGNLVALTDPLGRVTSYEYDLRQQLLRTVHPDGTVVLNAYDGAANLTRVVDQRGNETRFGYDARNRLIATRYADGAVERIAYDGGGRVVRTTDARGHATDHTYDALGRRLTTVDALGQVSSWTYDELGNRLTARDPRLNTTTYRYDLRNRVRESEDALGNITYYTYDANGNLETVTDPLSRTVAYGYDVLDRQTSETDGLGHSTITAYDAVGNAVRVTDALGHKTDYGYDALNRLTQVVEDPDNLGYTTVTTYDAAGNVLSVTDPEGNTTRYEYDALDRVIAETNPLGLTRHFTYDAAGNLVSTTDRNGRVRQYTFDARNRLTAEVWLNAALQPIATLTRSYDSAGNLLEVSSPDATYTYEYDAVNRATKVTIDHNGAELGTGGPQTYTGTLAPGDYVVGDGGGGAGYLDLYTFAAESGAHYVVDFESTEFDTYLILVAPSGAQYHDADGGEGTNSRLDLILNETGTWQVWATSYPSMGTGDYTLRIDDGSVPGLTLEYAYDAAGNVTSVVDSRGGTTQYGYDGLNRVTWITQTGAGVADKRVGFTYDDAGQMTGIARYADLAGTVLVASSSYTYDPTVAGRLTALTHSKGVTVLAAYTWVFDDAGRILQMTTPDGTSSFNYDHTNQLTGADHSYRADEGYSYDDNGNRTNAGYVTGPNNRLLSDGAYTYAYDNEGNLVSRTAIATGAVRRFAWDHRNRLVAVTDEDPAGTATQRVQFAYDALDRRIAKSVDTDPLDGVESPVTYFVYDGEDVVLEFNDADGPSAPGVPAMARRYLQGPGLDLVLAQQDAAGSVDWLLGDHLGTVRDIVDAGGAVLNHRTYDTFGVLIAESHADAECRYAFTGREYDVETGLHYNRARYYEAGTGRFISEDPLGFAGGDANVFRYVRNNPVVGLDPLGLGEMGYLERSLRQLLLGNYADDVTLLGTGLQIGTSLLGVDLPGDIRDLFYDITNWEWSWGHAGQTAIDLVALLPVIGMLKYGDEVGALLKSSDEFAAGARNAPVVIGENMDRVNSFSKNVGGYTIDDWLGGRQWTSDLNDEFIATMKAQGRDFIDIGPDFNRRLLNRVDPTLGRPPSAIYGGERQQLLNYENYWRMYERTGKYQGGVPGFDP